MYLIEAEALRQKVHRALKNMIINGDLKPGQKLLQDSLAERLGVSRTPLLSAFSSLEQENLVETIPRRGAYVRKYNDKELKDIYNILIRLEPLGAREAAAAVRPEDIARLEKLNTIFDAALDKLDEGEIRRADYDFHMEILRCGGNKFLYNIVSTFIIIMINTNDLSSYREQCKTEHRKLIGAIKKGNPDDAESIMLRHLSTFFSRPVRKK